MKWLWMLVVALWACAAEETPTPAAEDPGGTLFDPGGQESCADAESNRSYVGCDFWPTVTANPVWSVFDFAAVVANAGSEPATVQVSRGDEVVVTTEIGPRSLGTIYLPWVQELKAPGEADECYQRAELEGSVFADDGAYHLVSSRPVTVYQFNALEYTSRGGPVGKDWSSCPGRYICEAEGVSYGCHSFSNDASLLLPSTVMTGTYRVASTRASSGGRGFLAITATKDGTAIEVQLSAAAAIAAGDGIEAVPNGGVARLYLNRGDVAELIGTLGSDFSGTLVTASKPVQVIAGMPCVNVPLDAPACDHIEESLPPAETLGARYLVVRPTGPNRQQAGHVVRMYGNFDGTALSYPSGAPAGAPSRIDAGDVIDLGVVDIDFEVVGSQSFAIASFMLGGSIVDPTGPVGAQRGDPSQAMVPAAEQFRSDYVFLAPADYEVSFVDVVLPLGATVTLDDQPIVLRPTPIGASDHGVLRLELGLTAGGVHHLTSSAPVGIQVAGYGSFTSYYYPGGLDLKPIAPPPLK